MAVAFDAATENVAAADPQSFTHTPSGTPRGVIVLIAHNQNNNDIITGVTYGGVAMTRVRTQVDGTTPRQGRVYAYRLTTGIPTGARTVSVDRTNSSTTVQVVCATVTAAADTEIIDSDGISGGPTANPAVTLQYGGRTALAFAALYSGSDNATPSTGETLLFSEQISGSWWMQTSRQTTPGTADFTIGFTAAGDRCAFVALAISEVPAGGITGVMNTTIGLGFIGTGTVEVPVEAVPAPPGAARVAHVELWTDVEANGGTRIALVNQLLGLEETAGHDGEHSISLRIALDHPVVYLPDTDPDFPNLRVDQVLRLVKTDGTWTEHRISEPARHHQRGALTRTVIARSIFQDLGMRGIITRTRGDGTSTTTFEALSLHPLLHLQHFVIPTLAEAGQPFWDLGTVELDGIDPDNPPIDLVYDGDTPLSALRKIAAAVGERDIVVRGTSTRYFIDLLRQAGSTLSTLTVRARRNLVDLGFTERGDDQATRVYLFGAPFQDQKPTLGQAEWAVTNVVQVNASTLDITLADPTGGAGPIAFDGQFLPPAIVVDDPNTEFVEHVPSYHLHYMTGVDFLAPIIATTAATQVVRVQTTTPASGSLFGRRAKIVADALLRENLFVDHPTHVKEYGVRVATLDRTDIPATDNLVPNAVCRDWPANSNTPAGWGKSASPIVTRETSPRYWENGGQAIRCRFPAGAVNALLTVPLVRVPHRAQGYLSFFVRVTTLVGTVQVIVHVQRASVDWDGNPTSPFPWVAGGSGYIYQIPNDGGQFADDPILPQLTNIQLNTPEDLGIAAFWDLNKYPLYGGTVIINFVASVDKAETEFIVEAAQVTRSSEQMPLMDGSGPIKLHQAANRQLTLYSTPAPVVSVNLLDLATAQGLTFPYTPLVVGRPIRIEDPDADVGAVETRVVGWTRDWHRRVMPSVELSNARSDLTTLLAPRLRATRHGTTLLPPTPRGRTFPT